jgi:biotin operon repressor
MLNKITTLLEKFDYLHFLIRKGKTGCAEKLAEKTGISRRTLFEILEDLRDQGIPVEYDKTTGSYEFKGDVKFLFEVTVDGEKIVHIKGG